MTVESAPFVNSLQSANPADGDFLVEGDNHLRLIKAALVATFPNLNAAMTADPDELNSLDGRQTFIDTFLQAASAAAALTAIGAQGTVDLEKPRTWGLRETSNSSDGSNITWDMSVHSTLIHQIDTAVAVTLTATNPVLGAEYTLVTRRGFGHAFGYTNPFAGAITPTTGLSGVPLQNQNTSSGMTISKFLCFEASKIAYTWQENYTPA